MIHQFSSNAPFVRRPPGQRFNKRYTTPRVKTSPSVMIWGGLTTSGTAGLWFMPKGTTITGHVYRGILQEQLQQAMEVKGCHYLQHDGAPVHTAKLVTKWLSDVHIPLIGKWPGSSADLNPIEHCWCLLKGKVAALKPTSEADLRMKTRFVWENDIPIDFCEKLVFSMPSRISAILKAKGGTTRF
jgi:hypothetical protein